MTAPSTTLLRAALLVAMAAPMTTANAAPAGGAMRLQLEVPVLCKLAHRGDVTESEGTIRLGTLRQFCNAPGGFVVTVGYTPGTMRGSRLQVGNAQLVLDGSGQAELLRAPGPRIAEDEVILSSTAARQSSALRFDITPL